MRRQYRSHLLRSRRFWIQVIHQPAAFVSGDPDGRDVPVHVIGPPALVALVGDGWTPGLLPAPDAAVLPMQAFRDHLLQSFGGAPRQRQAAMR